MNQHLKLRKKRKLIDSKNNKTNQKMKNWRNRQKCGEQSTIDFGSSYRKAKKMKLELNWINFNNSTNYNIVRVVNKFIMETQQVLITAISGQYVMKILSIHSKTANKAHREKGNLLLLNYEMMFMNL